MYSKINHYYQIYQNKELIAIIFLVANIKFFINSFLSMIKNFN